MWGLHWLSHKLVSNVNEKSIWGKNVHSISIPHSILHLHHSHMAQIAQEVQSPLFVGSIY